MLATVHQPTFLPYLGFFRKAAQADIFVVYDTAQYSRGDWHNRNRILGQGGPEWLTVPVTARHEADFLNAKLSDSKFVSKHLSAIRQSYAKAPFYDRYYPEIERLYRLPATSLAEFNWRFIEWIFSLIGIAPKIIHTSEIPGIQNLKSTEALVAIVQAVGADAYLSGPDGRNYLDASKFSEAGIALLFNEFNAQEYRQLRTGTFVPNLSIIDALMYIGAEGVRSQIGI